MRGIIIFICTILCAGTVSAGDLSNLLLSDHTALVAPGTPDIVIEHLARQQNALLYRPAGDAYDTPADIEPAVVMLPKLAAGPREAADSAAAWAQRYQVEIAILPQQQAAARAWRESLKGICTLFEPVSEFQAGDIALPYESGYLIYRGPRSAFFDPLPSPLEAIISHDVPGDATLPPVAKNLASRVTELQAVCDTSEGFSEPVLYALAAAVGAADTAAAGSDTTAAVAQTFARRWRSILAARIRPECDEAEFSGLAGTAADGAILLRSHAPVEVRIDSIRALASGTTFAETTTLPQTLSAWGELEITGQVLAVAAGHHRIPGRIYYTYAGVALVRRITIQAAVTASLDITFDPPILYAADIAERPDPDYRVKAIPGKAVITNRTESRRQLRLAWSADDPVDISATLCEVTLDPGEVRELPLVLSVPVDWQGRYLDYRLRAEESGALVATATGRLWQQEPAVDGQPQAAVLGDAEPWLAALKAVHIPAVPLDLTYLADADLSPFRVVIISGTIAAPTTADRETIRKLAQRGRRIIVVLTPQSSAWLPWPIELERRPAPTTAEFYRKDFGWWEQPNKLLGECFAADSAGEVYTLPAGVRDWEPLIVDGGGKGFMYRRAEGEGWYVAIHDGWQDGIARMKRRPIMGLVNLAGRAIR